MVIAVAAATRGAYHTDAKINQVMKPTGAGTDYAVGLVTYLDPADDTFKTAPTTNAFAPFGVVCNRRPATTDTKMDNVVGGHVIVEADGAIAPGNYVAVSGATAGTVIEYAATGSPTATTAGTEVRRIVGRYIGKASGNERDGVTIASAADGDLIWVELGLAAGGL